MEKELHLRNVVQGDLLTFFEQQNDPNAIHMAAFTAKDPADLETFNAHWQRILAADTVIIKTVIWLEQVAGYILIDDSFKHRTNS